MYVGDDWTLVGGRSSGSFTYPIGAMGVCAETYVLLGTVRPSSKSCKYAQLVRSACAERRYPGLGHVPVPSYYPGVQYNQKVSHVRSQIRQ
jgi:hypothetical protein